MEKNDVYYMQTQHAYIGPGSTLAQYFGPDERQNCWSILSASGGSLAIVGVTLGMTLSAAQLVAAGSSGYMQFPSGGSKDIGGPACFYLLAQGATAVAHLARGYGSR